MVVSGKIAMAVVVSSLMVLAAMTTGVAAIRNHAMERELNRTQAKPVIVELFTSEGCSSCPPADTVLKNLAARETVGRARVIPLAMHVDYWNHLGWKDPYSTSANSARQSDYAHQFHNDTIYTPQMVVNGQTAVLGSDSKAAEEAIKRAAAGPKVGVSVMARVDDQFTVRVSALPPGVLAPGEKAKVCVAITEDDISNYVGEGENAGRELAHVAVVRRLETLGAVSAAIKEEEDGKIFMGVMPLKPEKTWKRDRLHVVAFVQAEKSRRILGAGQAVPMPLD